jgi:hypothetical protein
MYLARPLHVLALALPLSLLGSEAFATSGRVPVPVARRALTLPDATFRLDDGPYWPLPSGLVETTFWRAGDGRESRTRLNLGLGFGITDDFELGAHVLKLDVDPDTNLADPSVYLMYRFLGGEVELGLFGEVSAPFERNPLLTVGMPIALHIGDRVRLDTGPFVQFDFEDETNPDLIVPFQLPISVTQRVTFGPEAAVVLHDFEHDQFLLGFFAGYTLTAGGRTLGDIGGRLRLPSVEDGFDVFQLLFELDLFFDL